MPRRYQLSRKRGAKLPDGVAIREAGVFVLVMVREIPAEVKRE